MNLLIITACPNGQVTSVLCSRLLQAAAERLGWKAKVEVQDARAIGSPLSAADITAADLGLVVKTHRCGTHVYGSRSLATGGGAHGHRAAGGDPRLCRCTQPAG